MHSNGKEYNFWEILLISPQWTFNTCIISVQSVEVRCYWPNILLHIHYGWMAVCYPGDGLMNICRQALNFVSPTSNQAIVFA